MPAFQTQLRMDSKGYPWEALTDAELLKWRICDLKLALTGSDVEPMVHRLCQELAERQVAYAPPCYFTTEWLAPDKVPLIGIPFCLAHPRLRQLERSMMLEVEGETEKACMKLLRHEAGHALNYAYRFYRRSRWRELFGPFSLPYDVNDYYPRPYSRQFVVHLEGNYAQAHPDEDFAETFAVWLTPGLDWKKKYQDWGALKKLEYVDHLMSTEGRKPATVTAGKPLWPINRVRARLETYYQRKRTEFAEGYPGYYDPDLRRLFTAAGAESAAAFLHRHRRALTNHVAEWARVPKISVDHLIRRLSNRCREMGLHLPGTPEEALGPVTAYLTALACSQREG